MKLNEMSPVLTPVISKKATRTFNTVKKESKRFGKANAEMKVLSETSVRIDLDFQHWMRPESIDDAYDELSYAIKKVDVEGHIHSLDEVGHGAEFVEALLTGLKPGMKLSAEAFFPTLSFEIKWKNIIKK